MTIQYEVTEIKTSSNQIIAKLDADACSNVTVRCQAYLVVTSYILGCGTEACKPLNQALPRHNYFYKFLRYRCMAHS